MSENQSTTFIGEKLGETLYQRLWEQLVCLPSLNALVIKLPANWELSFGAWQVCIFELVKRNIANANQYKGIVLQANQTTQITFLTKLSLHSEAVPPMILEVEGKQLIVGTTPQLSKIFDLCGSPQGADKFLVAQQMVVSVSYANACLYQLYKQKLLWRYKSSNVSRAYHYRQWKSDAVRREVDLQSLSSKREIFL